MLRWPRPLVTYGSELGKTLEGFSEYLRLLARLQLQTNLVAKIDLSGVEFLTQSGPTSSSNPGPPRLREVPRVPAAAVGYLPALPAFLAFIDSRKR